MRKINLGSVFRCQEGNEIISSSFSVTFGVPIPAKMETLFNYSTLAVDQTFTRRQKEIKSSKFNP